MKLFSQNNQLMTEGSIPRHLIRFAIPLLIGNFLQQSYQLVDMVIVGRCIGDGGISIAAVGVGTSFLGMMIGLFMGLSTGAGIVISRAYGAGRTKRVKHSIQVALLLAAAVAVLITITSITSCDWILTLLHTTDDIFDLASLYLKIYALGFVPQLVYNMGTSVLQALGNSTSPLTFLAVTCVLNVILDLAFMGALHLGVGGAAAATVLSQCAAMVLVLRKIHQSDVMQVPGERILEGRGLTESRWILLTIIRYGVPIAIQQLTMSFSNMILQGHINLLGTGAIAAWSILGKIDGFILLPVSSFSMAVTTFTGQNYGAGRLDRIYEGKRYVTFMSVGTTVLLSTVCLLLCEPIVHVFDGSEAIMAMTKEMAWFMLPFYFTLALIRIYTGLFNGLGRPLLGSVTMILCMCFIRVAVVSAAFPLLHSAMAIYIAYYASWFSCMILLMLEYRLIIRKQILEGK
ncbi:MAG: MATE family efflux transporter [Firmicutes bacterium]|nr:MATE family efflux transporter [Bacillota bacterium]MDD7602681.1 MATE family efflux transporter [Bacillota bacterium]MDY5855442.1 MATE family efflux transporter [Anaerovoracaceae bacterium]